LFLRNAIAGLQTEAVGCRVCGRKLLAVVAVGAVLAFLPFWLYPLRVLRLWKARPYLTTFPGLDRPWAPLEAYLEGMEVRPVMFGTNYLARGRARIPV